MRSKRTICVVLITFALLFFGLFKHVSSASTLWLQNSWLGGSGQSSWVDSTKYLQSASISATIAEASLATTSGWFDSSWKYRQNITINNATGSAQTDFQVSFNINTASLVSSSKLKSDCSDLRLTDATGSAISYWVATSPSSETCNQTSTKIWVKLPSLLAETKNIYLYYGNTSATSQSNGNDVFSTFADFTSGSTLPTGWVKTDIGTAGTATVGDGKLTITNVNGEDIWENTYGGTHVYNDASINGSFIAETLITSQTNSDVWAKSGLMAVNSVTKTASNGQVFMAITPGNGAIFQYQSLPTYTAANVNLDSGVYNTPTHLKLTKNSSNTIAGFFSMNGTNWKQQGSDTNPLGVSNSQYVVLFTTPHNISQTGSSTYTYFFIRKYALEPLVSVSDTIQPIFPLSGSLTSSIFDTGQSSNFSTLNYTASTSTNTTITIKVRSSSAADFLVAPSFSSCNAISSGEDISTNNCVKDGDRYLQYQANFTSTDGAETPTLQSINIGYDPSTNTPSVATSTLVQQSSTTTPTCSDSPPTQIPNLFQIDTMLTQATLYFTPVAEGEYFISYSTSPQAEEFGVQASLGKDGVQNFTVRSLVPGNTYYFKIRGQHGCMPGNWSNIVSATTKSNTPASVEAVQQIAKKILPEKKLDVVSADLTPNTSNVCHYTTKTGDSLWKLAMEKLGDGHLYTSLKEMNHLDTNYLKIGQDLSLPCDPTPQSLDLAQAEINQTGIKLDIKVQNKDNKPVAGAKITLHSKIQETTTDTNGIAHFENVETGEHTVILAYQDYKGEQTLTVDDTNKEQTLTLTVQLNNGFSSPIVIITISVLCLFVIVLAIILFIILKKKSKSTNK